MSLTKAELDSWKEIDTTKTILKIIQQQLDEQVASVLGGNILRDTADETALNAARIAGRVDGLSFIFNLGEELDEQ